MTRRAWGSSLVGVLLLAVSVLPGSAQAATTTDTGATVSTRTTATGSTAAWRDEITRLINQRRAKIGCRALVANYYLFNAAYKHNNRMMAANTLSHQLSGESSLGVRVTAAGYTGWRMLAENLAYGATSASGIYSLWMNSSPHRTNIENCRYKDLGLAVGFKNGRPWVTADFGVRG